MRRGGASSCSSYCFVVVDVSDDVAVAGEGDGGVLVDDWGYVVPGAGGVLDGYHVVSSGEDEGVDAWFWLDCYPLCFVPVVVCAPGEELSYQVEHAPALIFSGCPSVDPHPFCVVYLWCSFT